MRRLSRSTLLLVILIIMSAATILAAVGDDQWRAKVPQSARLRPNPIAGDPNSVAAGAKLFQQNCATCQGKQAEGHAKSALGSHQRCHSRRTGMAAEEWKLEERNAFLEPPAGTATMATCCFLEVLAIELAFPKNDQE